MYAGVGRTNSSNINSNPVEFGVEIPEWKRLLIMRKRAGACSSVNSDEVHAKSAVSSEQGYSHFRNPVTSYQHGNSSPNCHDNNLQHAHNKFSSMLGSPISQTSFEGDKSSHDSVLATENGEDDSGRHATLFPLTSPDEPPDEEEEQPEDLQYGPGIVDKLRARFLNLGRKNKRRPVVRKFSSLENLSPGGYGSIRAIGPGNKLLKGDPRKSGIRPFGNQHIGGSNFKKAQSMETLLVGSASNNTDSSFASRRNRLFVKSLSPGYSPKYTPESSFHESRKKFEYSRQISNSNINEEELPKPDTVKQVKKLFESPTVNEDKPKCRNPTLPEFNAIAMCGNIRPNKKLPSPSTVVPKTPLIIPEEDDIVLTNDDSAKSSPLENSHPYDLHNGLSTKRDTREKLDVKLALKSPDQTNGIFSNENHVESLSDTNKALIESAKFSDKENSSSERESSTLNNNYTTSSETFDGCLSLIERDSECGDDKKEQLSSQGSQVTAEAEHVYHVTSMTRSKPHPHQSNPADQNTVDILTASTEEEFDEVSEDEPIEDMVVASASQNETSPHHIRTNDSPVSPQSNDILNFEKKNWKKPPQSTTSVVFDFRGKDVKPNISLNPTPFGCKPAKVKKRAGSPPRGNSKVVNGLPCDDQIDHDVDNEDEEDWDEMDIGADLPAISGISFHGENVKIGRGALLETRNKKLTIQFNDEATETFEYPCESPIEDYATDDDSTSSSIKSSNAIGSYSANTSLSSYTPHVLDNSEEFQLGISRPTHRPPPPLPPRIESPVAMPEVIIPVDSDETAGWSATETSDILF